MEFTLIQGHKYAIKRLCDMFLQDGFTGTFLFLCNSGVKTAVKCRTHRLRLQFSIIGQSIINHCQWVKNYPRSRLQRFSRSLPRSIRLDYLAKPPSALGLTGNSPSSFLSSSFFGNVCVVIVGVNEWYVRGQGPISFWLCGSARSRWRRQTSLFL